MAPLDGTRTGISTQGQSGPKNNERVLHIPQSSRTGVSPSDAV